MHFVTFKSCHLVTGKHFPIYDLAWNQQYFYSCLYALKPFPNMCTLIFMFNFFVLKDGIWSPSEWVQKLIRGCEFLASDNNLLLIYTTQLQVNSAFLAHWLDSLEMIIQVLFSSTLLNYCLLLKTFPALCVLSIQDMLKVSSSLARQVNTAVFEEVIKKKSVTKKV